MMQLITAAIGALGAGTKIFWGWAMMRGVCLTVIMTQMVVLWVMRGRERVRARESWRDRSLRAEMEAYARLDCSTAQEIGEGMETMEAGRALAKRVCQTIAEQSAFSRAALLLRTASGGLSAAGSVGMDDLTLAALVDWGERPIEDESAIFGRRGFASSGTSFRGIRENVRSLSISLGEWVDFDREVGAWALMGKRERRRWRRGIVAPLRTQSGRVVGAIVVCADGPGAEMRGGARWPGGMEGATGPIEALAAKLSRGMENDLLAERLQRAEKLAGLGQLAGGVAHALNNPLTAVLGFAELIAETTSEPRVRQDARTVQIEAKKMKETVLKLVEFWRPVPMAYEAVEIMTLLRELEAACAEKLAARGVKLEILGPERMPPIRGSGDRMRQVMEHLLNNAAQAIGAAQAIAAVHPSGANELSARVAQRGEQEHAIQVTVAHDERTIHVMVSDTGTGFREPGRVFDPFYTTKEPGEGPGLGLSLCYGIVREHGGEISARNLHPHGAAVVLELPVRRTVREESVLLEQAG